MTVRPTPCAFAGGKHDFRRPVGDGTYRCSAPGCGAVGVPPHRRPQVPTDSGETGTTRSERHTRESDPKNGPDFCRECSDAAKDWVAWPCGYVAAATAIERALDAILDIDAHAAPLGEDSDGFVAGGYVISTGSLHRALGVVGHTATKCRYCAKGKRCEEFRAEAAEQYQRESLEALCDAAGIDHVERPNFLLLDDLLDHIGGPGTATARWERLRTEREAHPSEHDDRVALSGHSGRSGDLDRG